MKRRSVVLGALGLMGTEVVKKLQANGTSIVAIDRKPPPEQLLQLLDITWISGCVDDIDMIASIIRSGDDIFHFAEFGFPEHSEEWKEGLKSFERLEKLCLLAIQNNCRLIYPSSGGTVYGRALQTPISEDHSLSPISLYGLFKKMSEELLLYHNRVNGLHMAIIRVANCYGPSFHYDKMQGIIGVAAKSLLDAKTMCLVAEGKQVRDFVHARDIAELCLAIHLSDVACTIVNAGSGTGVSVMEVVQLIASEFKISPDIELLPSRSFDVMNNVLNSTKAFELFGWTANISFEEGVREVCRILLMQNATSDQKKIFPL